MNEFIKDLLREKSGKFSSRRLMSLTWFFIVCLIWVYACIKSGEVVEIPNGVYMMSGVILGSQAVSKFGEK